MPDLFCKKKQINMAKYRLKQGLFSFHPALIVLLPFGFCFIILGFTSVPIEVKPEFLSFQPSSFISIFKSCWVSLCQIWVD